MNSLYKQVSSNILEQITTGQLKVGDRLPPENDFANEIGVSRSTLRLAFDELESVGVLSRRKRTGTTIIADEPIPKIIIPQAPFEAHLKFLKESVYKVEKLSMVNAAKVPELKEFDSDSDQWLELYGWRAKDIEGKPVCTHLAYVPECFSDIDVSLNDEIATVTQLIHSKYSLAVGRIIHSTESIACSSRDALSLGLTAGQPVLAGKASLYSKDDTLLEYVITVYHPDRHVMKSELVFG